MTADAYVWSDAEDPNLYGEWDFEVRMFILVGTHSVMQSSCSSLFKT
jgi:hypothetical protein